MSTECLLRVIGGLVADSRGASALLSKPDIRGVEAIFGYGPNSRRRDSETSWRTGS
jgi:hypothetical protein